MCCTCVHIRPDMRGTQGARKSYRWFVALLFSAVPITPSFGKPNHIWWKANKYEHLFRFFLLFPALILVQQRVGIIKHWIPHSGHKKSHGWKVSCATWGDGGLCWFQPQFFPQLLLLNAQRLACNAVVFTPCCQIRRSQCLEIHLWKKMHTFLLENNEVHLSRSVFANPSTQRSATGSGQAANISGKLFRGKTLITHDATKSSTDHPRLERQYFRSKRGLAPITLSAEFLTFFSEQLFWVSKNVACKSIF